MRRRRQLALWLAVLTLPSGLYAQTRRTPSPATAKPAPDGMIRELQVTGNSRYTQQQVVEVSGLKAGVEPSQAVFEAARDRLLATGAFESVGWRYQPSPEGGFLATLEVSEVDQFLLWMLDRLPVDAAEFEALAVKRLPLFSKEIPATDIYMQRAAAIVQELAKAKGFQDEVIGRVNLVGKDKMMVVFQPKTPAPNVVRVVVNGVSPLWKGEVQKSMNQVAVGTPFSETNIRLLFDSQAKSWFDTVGRLQAKATKITTAPVEDARGVAVTIDVDEGPEFKLAGVEVEGTPFNKNEIDEDGEWPVGKAANFSAVGIGLNKITAKLKKKGHLKAEYRAFRRIDAEKAEVWLTIKYDPGPQYVMGRLNLVGLDIESEPVIRKLYAVKTGEPFDAEYPDFFLKQVRDRGIFDFLGETKAETKIGQNTHRVDVTLIFKGEAPKEKSRRPGA